MQNVVDNFYRFGVIADAIGSLRAGYDGIARLDPDPGHPGCGNCKYQTSDHCAVEERSDGVCLWWNPSPIRSYDGVSEYFNLEEV